MAICRKQLFSSKSKKVPWDGKLQELIRGRRKTDRCQEDVGLGGQAKDGPDPTFNPRSFSFVWSHIWPKFPSLSWVKRKSSGWVDGGSERLPPPRINSRNTVDSWVTKPGREQTSNQTYEWELATAATGMTPCLNSISHSEGDVRAGYKVSSILVA